LKTLEETKRIFDNINQPKLSACSSVSFSPLVTFCGCLSIHASVCLHLRLTVFHSCLFQSVCPLLHLCLFPFASVCMHIRLSVLLTCMSVSLVCLSNFVPDCLYVYLSILSSVSLSTLLFALSAFTYFYLSLFPSIYPFLNLYIHH
jgi:hypothetical protein